MAEDPRYGQSQTLKVFENDLIKLERAQKALLCDISSKLSATPDVPLLGNQTGIDCNGDPVIVPNSVLTTPSPGVVQLVKLCPSETQDPEVVCLSNDGGLTTVTGWEVFNITATGLVTSKVYLGGVDVTGTYQVVPCGVKVRYDYEFEKICVDGKQWTKVLVFDPSSALPVLISVFWLDELDAPQPAPLASLINNVNCTPLATPSISDAFGDDLSTLLEGTSFTITKPDCCKVLVTTSIGTFTLREKETYYSTDKYDNAFKIELIEIVSGNCLLNQIHIISNKTK